MGNDLVRMCIKSHELKCRLSLFKSNNRHLVRRERDSNPRYPFEVYSLSRGALSTTQPSLQVVKSKFFDSLKYSNLSKAFATKK